MTKEEIKINLNEILKFIKFAGNMIPTEHYSWDSEKYDWIESLNEAIGMLDQEPCEDATLKDIFCMGCEYKEQDPCDDVISRQAAIDGINQYFHDEYYQRTSMQDCRDCLIEDVIKPLPPVTPQYTEEEIQKIQELEQAEIEKAYELGKAEWSKTGHWIDRFPAKECKCSVCDFLICISNGSYVDMVDQMKYCPNCGAKMGVD